ncbi:tryptophan RNA-binding attenuator protein-like domain-containing protein [Peziza echinospora]|nr:tryptophan RNA-binding attenuator protein-like domain-containing protein [Peziza echinospora]
MSGVPPNYPGGGAGYFPQGDQKSPYGPGQPPQQQFSPPPPQAQFSPPPGQPGMNQQQYYPPPPVQQQGAQGYAPPPGHPGSPGSQQNRSSIQQPIHNAAFNPAQQGPPPAAPAPAPQAQGGNVVSDTLGSFNGGSYRIDHRDCNTLLTFQLAHGCPVFGKPGSMVAMSASVTLKGSVKFSFKKLVAGGEMTQSTFTGPGELLLAPPALGDIVPIRLDGQQTWSVGKDGLLAYTQGVVKDFKSQGLGKAMFSGEGLFVYKVSGQGVLFITSLGAIIQKNMAPGEQYIVDNDHLVAWNCKYTIERVASGGIISSMTAAEGLVCKFTGPGTVFIQTRNPTAFGAWIASHMAGGQR